MSIAGLALASSPAPAALELTAAAVPPDAATSLLAGEGAKRYLQTGVPKLDLKTGVHSYLAVSPINPVAGPSTPASRALAEDLTAGRPMTWSEASTACDSYDAAGKTWRLPTLTELSQLNNVARFWDVVLDGKGELADTMKAAWTPPDRFIPQYVFFWTSDAPQGATPGLKMAGFFGKGGKYQSMSEARPLSTVCVTYFTGPGRARDRIATPMADYAAGDREG